MCDMCKWDCDDCTEDELCRPCAKRQDGWPTDSNGDFIEHPDA